MKRLIVCSLLVLFCAASVSAATLTVLGQRQFSLPMPKGWTLQQTTTGDQAAGQKLDTIVIDDPAGSFKLALSFIPAPENRDLTKDEATGLMGELLGELLAGAVERKLSFTVVDSPGGFEAHSFFTDKKLVGVTQVPKDEWRYVTAGVRTFKGAFVFFTLLTNDATSPSRTKALSVVAQELVEVTRAK